MTTYPYKTYLVSFDGELLFQSRDYHLVTLATWPAGTSQETIFKEIQKILQDDDEEQAGSEYHQFTEIWQSTYSPAAFEQAMAILDERWRRHTIHSFAFIDSTEELMDIIESYAPH